MRKIPPRPIHRESRELDCSIEATDCDEERRAILRNLSLNGARLEGADVDGCPENFELRIVHPSGAIERVFARCVWRKPGAIGVQFEDGHVAARRRALAFSRAS